MQIYTIIFRIKVFLLVLYLLILKKTCLVKFYTLKRMFFLLFLANFARWAATGFSITPRASP